MATKKMGQPGSCPKKAESESQTLKGLNFDIIRSYHYLSSLGKSYYSQSSQMKMILKLKQMYGQQICRRTLNYHLRYLEDSGFLKRIKRHKRGQDGKILFHTTIIIPLKKSLQALARVSRWFKLVKWRNLVPKNIERVVRHSEFVAHMAENYRKHVFKT